jgi:hypothetical protein
MSDAAPPGSPLADIVQQARLSLKSPQQVRYSPLPSALNSSRSVSVELFPVRQTPAGVTKLAKLASRLSLENTSIGG